MHVCACRIVQGDITYCSPQHAYLDTLRALEGNQHTFYRAYWRRYDPVSPPPGGAVVTGRGKPLPKPPRPAREEEECVRYPILEREAVTRPALKRFPEYVKQLPEPPSTWSLTTRATTAPHARPHHPHPTARKGLIDQAGEEEPVSRFSAWTTTTHSPDLAAYDFPPLPGRIRQSQRMSDLQSLCTTPDLEQGRFSVITASDGDDDPSDDSSDEEEGEPPGSATLMKLGDWLEEAGEKLARLHLRSQLSHDGRPCSPTLGTGGQSQVVEQEVQEERGGKVPPPLPPKPKLMHRECSVHLPSTSHPYAYASSSAPAAGGETPRISTATAREKVYDDLRKHSIFRAYFQDVIASEPLADSAQGRGGPMGGRKGHARKMSERWGDAPPVPAIPEQYRSQAKAPHPTTRQTSSTTAEGSARRRRVAAVKTDSIHPLRIRKLTEETAPPTPPKPHLPSSSPPLTPPKDSAASQEGKSSPDMTPQEYRDSLAAASGWVWEPALPSSGEGRPLEFLEEDPYPMGVWRD